MRLRSPLLQPQLHFDAARPSVNPWRLSQVGVWAVFVASVSALSLLIWCVAAGRARGASGQGLGGAPELMVLDGAAAAGAAEAERVAGLVRGDERAAAAVAAVGEPASAGPEARRALVGGEAAATEAPVVDAPAVGPRFAGRPVRVARRMWMKVTGYSPDARSCGRWADGKTASGYSVWTNGMKLVAADTRLLPFGSLVSVPGYNAGRAVPVLDRGGKIKGHRLDLLFPTHEQARRWGVRRLEVTVWEYAD